MKKIIKGMLFVAAKVNDEVFYFSRDMREILYSLSFIGGDK